MQPRGPAASPAEFIGTFALVFFVTMVVVLYVVPAPAFTDFSVIGLVHVLVLFFLIQTLAIISGAHFNPAVTVALAAIRQIGPVDALIYVVSQLAGGVAGALLTKALLLDEGEALRYGAPQVSSRIDEDMVLGAIAEGTGTFFLMFAIVGVAVNPRGLRDWAGLVIGGTLGLAVMVLAPLTGAGLNPARSFGPALVANDFGGAGDFIVVYVVGPIVGALLAAFAYSWLFLLPGMKGVEGMEPVG